MMPNNTKELVGPRGWLSRLVREFVVRRYVAAGLSWGDAESYSGYLGECVGYAGMLRKLNRWEVRYSRLGFKPVDKRVWVEAGGYGKDYASKLYLPNVSVVATAPPTPTPNQL